MNLNTPAAEVTLVPLAGVMITLGEAGPVTVIVAPANAFTVAVGAVMVVPNVIAPGLTVAPLNPATVTRTRTPWVLSTRNW